MEPIVPANSKCSKCGEDGPYVVWAEKMEPLCLEHLLARYGYEGRICYVFRRNQEPGFLVSGVFRFID